MSAAAWDAETLAEAARGAWRPAPGDGFAALGVSIDTREVKPQNLFVALEGERADGHDFLDRARDAGASAAVVERVPVGAPESLPLLVVDDAVRALHAMAGVWRTRLRDAGTRVIAVTGSNGKTTCVRLMHAALRPALRGGHAPRSFNNHLGVPITLLNARPGDDYLICEIGMNAPGEIAELARLASPDVCVITSIGRAHVGGLMREGEDADAGLAHVAREKWSLFTAAPGGAVRITTRAAFGAAQRFGWEASAPGPVTLAAEPAEIRQDASGVSFAADGVGVRVPLVGAHNAQNGALALAVARAMGVAAVSAVGGLAGAEGPPMRLQVERLGAGAGAITLLNDAYNANPDSVVAAIETLAAMDAPGPRLAVLGDMLELGSASEALHAEVGARAAAAGLDGVWAFGPEAGAIARAARAGGVGEVRHEPADARVFGAWAGALRPGSVVLVKGSRGVRLERFVEALFTACGAARDHG